MAAEDVQTVRESFELLEQGGIEAVLHRFHPDFETTTPPDLTVEPDTYRGHEGLRRYFASFYEVMDEVRFIPEEFIDAGDRVVVPIHLIARSRETGLTFDQQAAMVWRLRDGLAVGLETFATRAEALRAVGLEAA